jgi:hypothetical protein
MIRTFMEECVSLFCYTYLIRNVKDPLSIILPRMQKNKPDMIFHTGLFFVI